MNKLDDVRREKQHLGRWEQAHWPKPGDAGGGEPTWGCMRSKTCCGAGPGGEEKARMEPRCRVLVTLTEKGFCVVTAGSLGAQREGQSCGLNLHRRQDHVAGGFTVKSRSVGLLHPEKGQLSHLVRGPWQRGPGAGRSPEG